ncbi:hypothetical protein DSO57_1007625 [Entomophthora muscae]|nr:hypothetical protein DSO57_1007625 [Entomophthora muscae]
MESIESLDSMSGRARLNYCKYPDPTNLGITSERVEKLLASLSLEEKIGQMTQINTGNMTDPVTKRLDPKLVNFYVKEKKVGSFLNTMYEKINQPPPTPDVWVESINLLQTAYKETRSKIPMIYGIDSVHGANYVYGATLFPQQLGLAATFNRTAARVTAEVTAKDTRAVGIQWNFSPILDIAVNKQWPRVYETFGEDPYLAGQLGAEMIIGYQGCNELNSPVKVAATMKHFIGYSASRSGKDVDGSWASERIINDYFRPSFQHAMEAGAATVMESYSDIDGDHIVNSKKYLVDLLRKQMNFTGTLVTDWEQINKLHEPIHIAPTIKDAVRRVMKLGTVDVSMVPNDADFVDILLELVREGKVPEAFIDQSVRRILNLKEKVGLLDADGLVDPQSVHLASIGSASDAGKSLDAARESIILLQNNQHTLPLPPTARILVTGPTGDSLSYLTGGWTYTWQGPLGEDDFQGKGTTILQGLRKHTKAAVDYIQGVDIEGIPSTSIADLARSANDYDAVVLCLGEKAYTEFKGNINDMHLPRGQINLLETLVKDVHKPVIVVLSQGRPRVTGPSIRNASAVLGSFLVGPYGGDAISEVIYGITNPSGKLPITYSNHANDNNLNYYRRFNEIYDNVYWEFGHGLSYTTYSYSSLVLSSATIASNSDIQATVTVTNTGTIPGKEAVLFYITDEYRSISPEVKKLRFFEKIYLDPQQSKTVSFKISLQDLAFYNAENLRVTEAGTFILSVSDLKSKFELILPEGQESVRVDF